MQYGSMGIWLLIGAIILSGLLIRALPAANMTFFEPDNFYYYSILQQAHNSFLPAISAYDGAPPAESLGLYIPALLLMAAGLPVLWSMYGATLIAAALIMLLTYIFTMQLFKDRKIALLALIFIALIPASLTRTMMTEYRGDTFSAIFTLLMLIMLLKAYREHQVAWSASAGIIAALALVFWSGGTLTLAVLAFAVLGMCICAGFPAKPELHGASALLSAGSTVLMLNGAIAKSIPSPIAIGILLIAAAAILYLYLKVAKERFSKGQNAAILLLAVAAISAIFYTQIAAQGAGAPASQISELQPPNIPYLLSSYGILLFLTPAIALIGYSVPLLAIAIGMALTFLLFRKRPQDGAILLAAYFLVMLAVNAYYIRFDSLAAVPISIIAAYSISRLWSWASVALARIGAPSAAKAMRFSIMFGLLFIIATMLMVAYRDMATAQNGAGVDSNTTAAMAWIANNTPGNSSVFALWIDGSLIGALAHRKAFSDSVALQRQGFQQWSYYIKDNLSAFPVDSPGYVFTRPFYNNSMIGICLGVDNYSLMNCTEAFYPNGTMRQSYHGQFARTNFYRLQYGCTAIGCLLPAGESALKLVYTDGSDKVYVLESH